MGGVCTDNLLEKDSGAVSSNHKDDDGNKYLHSGIFSKFIFSLVSFECWIKETKFKFWGRVIKSVEGLKI